MPTPTITPTAAEASAIYWALDRGPLGTQNQENLRIYVFATAANVGVVTIRTPGGEAAGVAQVLGSGMFSEDSCTARVPGQFRALRLIGIVVMADAARDAFLANPSGYTADVDQRELGLPNPRQFSSPLADSGCRPAD